MLFPTDRRENQTIWCDKNVLDILWYPTGVTAGERIADPRCRVIMQFIAADRRVEERGTP